MKLRLRFLKISKMHQMWTRNCNLRLAARATLFCPCMYCCTAVCLCFVVRFLSLAENTVYIGVRIYRCLLWVGGYGCTRVCPGPRAGAPIHPYTHSITHIYIPYIFIRGVYDAERRCIPSSRFDGMTTHAHPHPHTHGACLFTRVVPDHALFMNQSVCFENS